MSSSKSESLPARAVVLELLVLIAEVDATDVTDDSVLAEDLGVSSLPMIEVLIGIERRLGVQIPDQDVPALRTVGDLVDYLERQ